VATYPRVDSAIVTGAGRGIGRSVALDLGAHGITVICVSKSDSCHVVAREIVDGGGKAIAAHVDISDFDAASSKVWDVITGAGGQNWIGVFAAAVLGPIGPFGLDDVQAWQNTLAVNLVGNLNIARMLLVRMAVSGWGRLVFFGGGGAAYEYPLFPAYAASKAAVVRATENLGEDLRGSSIAVVCLAPGAVETDMLSQVRSAGGEVRTTADVSETLEFLRGFCSDTGPELSGRFVHVRDSWRQALAVETQLSRNVWKLRRSE
jgi:3-oxoacyl-[acyl-carrier protein] reductase